MPEKNENVWAPWRMEYIDQLSDDTADKLSGKTARTDGDDAAGCFLCDYWQRPADDAEHHVLWRSGRVLVVMNRFPYTSGHMLIAPATHTAELEALDEATLLELTLKVRDAKRVVQAALRAEGFNIGLNLGRCAGAGLPGHLHWHVVPRWSGDTNFMSVAANARVIPISLESVYQKCLAAAVDLGIDHHHP